MSEIRRCVKHLSCLALVALLATPSSVVRADDTDLFRTNVPPNILIVVDNSKSMSHNVWSQDYDAAGTYACTHFRDIEGNKFKLYPQVQSVRLKTIEKNNIKTTTTDTGYELIDYDGTHLEDGSGNRLYQNVGTTDVGKGRAYEIDGTPLDDAGGNALYYQGGSNIDVPSHVTPRERAIAAGIDPMTFEFLNGTTVCGVAIPNGWSLFIGDPNAEIPTGSSIQYKTHYLDFLFSDEGEPARRGTFDPTTGNDGIRSLSSCLEEAPGTYETYRRTRLQALQLILRTVVCEVNQVGVVRFGIAQFRFRSVGAESNVNGGYVVLPVADFKNSDGTPNVYDLHGETDSHEAHLTRVVSKIGPDSTTPLAETLFQAYTYFMSRDPDDLPPGRDADGDETGETFPLYNYDTSQPTPDIDLDLVGGLYLGSTPSGDAPPSPMLWECQKNFVLFITDGGSFKDVFDAYSPEDTAQGFDDFDDLIGDHYLNPDGTPDETELVSSNSSLYLDDIAYFMNKHDFRPDMDGDQTIDTYTVGYAIEGSGAASLNKTAQNGNGLFFESSDADKLAEDIVKAITDMIDKAQSFTSATVPAARTTDGNNFYSSYFRPRSDIPFWDGHLKNFEFNADGDILTADGTCAVGTDLFATPPCATSGVLRTTANAFWDAAEVMPDPLDRNLYFGKTDATAWIRPPAWDTGVTRDDLNLVAADLIPDPYNTATGADTNARLDDLADRIVLNLAGCEFGTNCTTRVNDDGDKAILGDIFHSNPVVIGSPNSSINEASYRYFATNKRDRTRVIYAGANDGFLHAFNAGEWQTQDADGNDLAPPRHDRGTGVELFGFMPTWVRERVKALPLDGFPRSFYSVDGSPVVADVWMYRDFTTSGFPLDPDIARADKTEAQWRTVLLGGLRDGGERYYALDISDPSAGTYPGYLWEFPCEVGHCIGALNAGTEPEILNMGETWSDPVITRVRVHVNGGPQPGGYERWVAIFGAGYSEAGDPNSPNYVIDPSDPNIKKGRAIYMVDITTGQVLAKKHWSAVAVFENSEQIGFPEMIGAFASAPAVFDLNFDGFSDVVYIGDLSGRLWKWVIEDVGHDPINNAGTNASLSQPNWDFGIFFEAAFPSIVTIPPPFGALHFNSFFFPPTGVLRHGKLVLSLGSGERANPKRWDEDGDDANNNRYYVLRDDDPRHRGVSIPDPISGALHESDLADPTQLAALSCSAMQSSKKGYFVIARDAEKFITNSVVFLGNVLTGSFIPPDPADPDKCTKSGTAYLYRFGVDCGDGAFTDDPGGEDDQRRKKIGVGIPTRPRVSVGDINNPDDGGDCTNKVVVITSDGSIDNDCPGVINSSGVNLRTWRER